jgi:ATP-dependent protease ClpP protease subunit
MEFLYDTCNENIDEKDIDEKDVDEKDIDEKDLKAQYNTCVEQLNNITIRDVSKLQSERVASNAKLYAQKCNPDDLDDLLKEERLLESIRATVLRCSGKDHEIFVNHTKLDGTLFEGLDPLIIHHPKLLQQEHCFWRWAGSKLWYDHSKGRVTSTCEKDQRDNVIGVCGEYDAESANYICQAITRLASVAEATYEAVTQRHSVYFVFNTPGGDVHALQQILECMDKYRNRLKYIGIVAAPACAKAMTASCGGVHYSACDICILEPLSVFLMHEVHIIVGEPVKVQREQCDDKELDDLQKQMGTMTDLLYDIAEISVLARLMDTEKNKQLVCKVLRANSFIAKDLRQWLRNIYYTTYAAEMLHHARQHGVYNRAYEFLMGLNNRVADAGATGEASLVTGATGEASLVTGATEEASAAQGQKLPNVWKYLTLHVYNNTSRKFFSSDEMLRLGLCDSIGSVRFTKSISEILDPAPSLNRAVYQKDTK